MFQSNGYYSSLLISTCHSSLTYSLYEIAHRIDNSIKGDQINQQIGKINQIINQVDQAKAEVDSTTNSMSKGMNRPEMNSTRELSQLESEGID
jgi:hypothetical protein